MFLCFDSLIVYVGLCQAVSIEVEIGDSRQSFLHAHLYRIIITITRIGIVIIIIENKTVGKEQQLTQFASNKYCITLDCIIIIIYTYEVIFTNKT